jgi:hypothetical protein
MRGNTIAVVVGYRLNAVILPGRKIQGGEPILLVATSVLKDVLEERHGAVDLLQLATRSLVLLPVLLLAVLATV